MFRENQRQLMQQQQSGMQVPGMGVTNSTRMNLIGKVLPNSQMSSQNFDSAQPNNINRGAYNLSNIRNA